MKLYAIFGANGCGRGVMPVARSMLRQKAIGEYDLVFVDDRPPAECMNGHRVLNFEMFVAAAAAEKFVNVAIANSEIRERVVGRCRAAGIHPFSVIADNSLVFDANEIGEGAILCPFVTITSNVRIGRHFHANLYSYVEHDCVIGDFVTFAPKVCCNGNVVIEDHAYIGTGAILRQGQPGKPLVIGRGAVVGMGAMVTKDVPPGVTVVGNPARPMVVR